MFVTSTSGIKAFWRDPFRWYIGYVLKKVPKWPSVALISGKIWHVFMENLLNGVSREDALAGLNADFQSEIDAALVEGFNIRAHNLEKDRLIFQAAGELWHDSFPIETLAVEAPLQLTLDMSDFGWLFPARIVGRPDREIRYHMGGIGHFQHRSLSPGVPVPLYLETFHRNPHEGIYWMMLKDKYNEDPFGTFLSLTRKLSPKSIREKPDVALQQHLITITPDQAAATCENIRRTIHVMQAMASGALPMWQNPDEDLGRYGNSLDPYYEVIAKPNGMELLNDESRWVNAEERYPELQGVEDA